MISKSWQNPKRSYTLNIAKEMLDMKENKKFANFFCIIENLFDDLQMMI